MYYYMEHMKGYDLKRFFSCFGVGCIVYYLPACHIFYMQ